MPPLAHAMGFIDGKQRDLCIGQHIGKARRRHAFGRHIKQIEFAPSQLPPDLGALFGTKRGVERRGRNPGLLQRLHLITHQRDQRRDDYADPRTADGWDLVAHGLARAGGKQHHRIAAVRHMLDHIGLLPAKRLVPEDVAQHRERAGPLVAMGREQVERLKGFHSPFESWPDSRGNRRRRFNPR